MPFFTALLQCVKDHSGVPTVGTDGRAGYTYSEIRLTEVLENVYAGSLFTHWRMGHFEETEPGPEGFESFLNGVRGPHTPA